MTARKIIITTEVRKLLADLDVQFQQFDELTLKLTANAYSDLSMTDAVNTGADREHCRALIAALAYRLNLASTGRRAA